MALPSLAVGRVCRCKTKAGLRHSARVQFPRARHHSKRRRRWVGVKEQRNGAPRPQMSFIRRLRMVREDTGFLMKVIPVPRRRPMKKLSVRVHFLRWGDLLDDFSIYRTSESGLRVNDISPDPLV
ncbi:hypothetical protein TNCV_3145141 [Trichonephila clavipes]|nr:hypothetical protein TNCV_3145141 [Trichonephila clavipes]